MYSENRIACCNNLKRSDYRIHLSKLPGNGYELLVKNGAQTNFWKFNLNSDALQSLLREAKKIYWRGIIPQLRVQSPHISLPSSSPKITEIICEDDMTGIITSSSEPQIKFPRTRVIALPYDTKRKKVVRKRRKLTVASLLGDKEYYTCKNCFKAFDRKFNRTRHENSCHTSPLKFFCYICDASYQHPVHFADHVRSHEDIKIECPTCQKQFPTKGSMRAHARTHRASNMDQLTSTSNFRKDGKRKQAAVLQLNSAKSLGTVRIPVDFKVEL